MKNLSYILTAYICTSNPHLGWMLLIVAIIANIYFIKLIDKINEPTYHNRIKQFVNDCEIKT